MPNNCEDHECYYNNQQNPSNHCRCYYDDIFMQASFRSNVQIVLLTTVKQQNYAHQNYAHQNYAHQNYAHQNYALQNYALQNYAHQNYADAVKLCE